MPLPHHQLEVKVANEVIDGTDEPETDDDDMSVQNKGGLLLDITLPRRRDKNRM